MESLEWIVFIGLFILTVITVRDIFNLNNFNKDYDLFLNQMMDDGIKVNMGLKLGTTYYTCRFIDSEFDIWIDNYPYAYGSPYEDKNIYPSMRTRRRLANYIQLNKDKGE